MTLALNKLDNAVDASPAIVGSQLFMRGKKHLYCIEERHKHWRSIAAVGAVLAALRLKNSTAGEVR